MYRPVQQLWDASAFQALRTGYLQEENSSTLNSPRLIRLPLSLRDLTFQVLFEPVAGVFNCSQLRCQTSNQLVLRHMSCTLTAGPSYKRRKAGKAEVVDLAVLDIAHTCIMSHVPVSYGSRPW